MVENVGVAVEILSPSLSVQKFFPLPVGITAIPDVGRGQAMSIVAYLDIQVGHGRKNVGVAIEIAPPALSIQKLSLVRHF